MDIFFALATFALVASLTPGPNNLMLMASGANFGIRRSLPHLSGVVGGFVLMVVLVGCGLLQVFARYPLFYDALKVFSVSYLVFLAWKIAIARPSSAATRATPISLPQAALFQWVNPKAWAMALTAVTVYAPSQNLATIVMIASIFGLINLPSVFVWVVLGRQMQFWLGDGARLRWFNYAMALLLLASLYPVFDAMPA